MYHEETNGIHSPNSEVIHYRLYKRSKFTSTESLSTQDGEDVPS